MKLKKILAGVLAAAMIVTSLPVSGLGMTALADDTGGGRSDNRSRPHTGFRGKC